MTEPALATRCAELREPIRELVQSAFRAQARSEYYPEMTERIGVVQSILAAGTEGISDAGYLAWHRGAEPMLDQAKGLIAEDKGPEAWVLLKNPEVGLYPVSLACADCEGW
ncbi:hypothetical protein [Agromyces sp. LHK192]|uniref:hypothetical protein n=1 Tax=Agromyces sp. LHK192 TaxID=2498704 RepID=UPI000FD972DB|nr:hypothetical protein [Agromyces sp. LHK192]